MLCCCKIVHFIFIIFLFLEWGLNLNKTFSYSTALVNNELQFVFSLSASKTPLSATLSNFVSLFLSHVYFESEQNCTCVLFQTLSTHTLPTVMQGVNHRRPDTCPTSTFLAWNILCVSRTRDWKDNALSLSSPTLTTSCSPETPPFFFPGNFSFFRISFHFFFCTFT